MWRSFTCCVFGLIVFLSAGFALAANPDDFLAGIYTEPGTGLQLPYRLYVPTGYDPSQQYPMILWLHGASCRGTDNIQQVQQKYIDYLYYRVKYPQFDSPAYNSFLLVPQTSDGWLSYSDQPSDGIRMTLSVIDQLESTYSLDQTRLYVTGASMGGGGTWDIIWRRQGMFAAAVPVSGYGDTSRAYLMVDQPIWAFHSTDDPMVPVEYTREMIAAVRAAGGSPLYTEYPTGGHDTYLQAYANSDMYEWMYSQQTVPEPNSLILAVSGVVGMGCYLLLRRFRRRPETFPS
ncbi:MAG: carboxylesterase family protein [Thermoguttaceae bacterium]